MRRATLTLALLAALAGLQPAAAPAQGGPFSPVIIVNGRPITGWELEQRARFLQVIGVPGDPAAGAEKALIEDRVRQDAAKAAGIKLTAEQVQAGIAEFASRANLSPEQFVAAIGQAGVEAETFRDFVSAGLLWREVVRAKFAGKITVSEADIDRAISVTAKRGSGPRVLVSEIVVPASGAQAIAARDRLIKLTEEIRSEADFARVAREVSAAPSRDGGGRIGWIPVTNLPPQVRQAVLTSPPGTITPPVPVPGGVAIFQVRGQSEGGDIAAQNVRVEYAEFFIPGGRSEAALAEAARVRGKVDTCDDLYKVARGLPADQLVRETKPLTALPADVARELANLDEGESSTALTRGNALVFLMLCSRKAVEAEGGAPAAPKPGAPVVADATIAPGDGAAAPTIRDTLGFAAGPARDIVRTELVNQRLNGLADSYLSELVDDAVIVRP